LHDAILKKGFKFIASISIIPQFNMDNGSTKSYALPLLLIGCLFFSFGFITWANSQLIPYLEIACELTKTQSYYVATAFFAAYFVMSIPSSYVLKYTGFKKGMSIGLFIMAVGALLFIPAAQSRQYNLFLLGLFIIGSGLALLQTASNPYVTVLGPIESAAKRISIMGICNKLAGIIAVYVLGSIMLNDADGLKERLSIMDTLTRTETLDALAQRVIVPYICLAIALVLLGTIFLFMRLPENSDDANESVNTAATAKKTIWQYPHLLLGALAIFFYVGVEVISYDTFTGFGEYLGYPLSTAKHFASYTGYGLLVGYVFGIIAIPKYISQRKALVGFVLLSMVLVVLSMTLKGTADVVMLNIGKDGISIPTHPAIWCFALLGFSNSVMWPAIWPLALDGVGKYTKLGGALLVMCIVGGAVLPPLYGKIATLQHSAAQAYWIMLPCYCYILFFGLKGYKLGTTQP
jgi:FHS family L-fucose permease-like MFS transporter